MFLFVLKHEWKQCLPSIDDFSAFNKTKNKANTWCLHIFPLKSLWATFSKGLKDLKGRCFRAALLSTNREQQVLLGAVQGGSWAGVHAVFAAAGMLSRKPPKAYSSYLQPRAASSAHDGSAHRHTATSQPNHESSAKPRGFKLESNRGLPSNLEPWKPSRPQNSGPAEAAQVFAGTGPKGEVWSPVLPLTTSFTRGVP